MTIIKLLLQNVNEEISGSYDPKNMYSCLQSEGYAGGYRDALYDVQLILNGNLPTGSRYWNHGIMEKLNEK